MPKSPGAEACSCFGVSSRSGGNGHDCALLGVGTRLTSRGERVAWSGGFLACELLPDVGLLQDMRGSSFSRAIELWSSTQTDQSPWAEWVHATYVRRFRRAGSAGEFGEEGACCSRGPIACAVRFRACGRGIGAGSGLDGRYDHSAQGAICRLPWSVHSAAFDVGIDSLVKQRV